jgi:hypothetical protein
VAVNLIYTETLINYTTNAPAASVKQTPMPVVPSARRGFLKKTLAVVGVVVLAGVAAKIGLSILSNQPVVPSETALPINPGVAPRTNAATATTASTATSVASSVPEVFSDPRISDLVASEVTDNRVFYRVDINPIPPSWTLTNGR